MPRLNILPLLSMLSLLAATSLAACDAELADASGDTDGAVGVDGGSTWAPAPLGRAHTSPGPTPADPAPSTALSRPPVATLSAPKALALVEAWIRQGSDQAEQLAEARLAMDHVGAILTTAAVGAARDPRTPIAGDWWALVLDGEPILASGDEVDERWVTGDATWVDQADGRYVLERRVDPARLPARLRGLIGQRVALVDTAGRRCPVELTGFAARSRFYDYTDAWGLAEEFGVGEDRNRSGDPVASWDDGAVFLTGTVKPVAAACGAARYAVSAASDTVQVLRVDKLTAPDRRAALRAFRRLGAYAKVQAEYDEGVAHGLASSESAAERWDEYGGATPIVTRFRGDTGREIVVVAASSGEGCGDPGGDLVATFEVTRKGRRMILRPLIAQAWGEVPRGFVDVDGDGVLRVFSGARDGTMSLLKGGELETLEQVDIPDFTPPFCPC